MGALSPIRYRRVFAAVLASILASEPVAASLSEASVWKERRTAASANNAALSSKRFEVASLPAPSLATVGEPFAVSSRTAPAARRLNPVNIQQAVLSLPWSLGRISTRATPSARTVVHIQDVHLNAEAQKNIGGAVAALLPWAGAVAIEGEWGPLRLDGFRAHPRSGDLKRVADSLLKDSLLDGPLHALLTNSRSVPVFGADDAAHYAANVDSYRRAQSEKAAARSDQASRARELDAQKAELFSSDLIALDAAIGAYHDGRLPLGNHLQHLCSRVGNAPAVVKDFLEAFRLEGTIDLNRTGVERRLLIEELSRRLDDASARDLIDRSLAFKAGTEGAAGFYAYLVDVCRVHGVDLKRFPSMAAYLDYVLIADRIDPVALQSASIELERRAVNSLVRSEAERRLIDETRHQRLIGKLLEFSLSPEEWREYRSEEGRDPRLASFENFYREAEFRDAAMATRLLDLFASRKLSSIVLVTGGFHSVGVRDALEKNGISVIDWTPRVTNVDAASGSRALDVFAQEKAPLDSIFEGRKLFLAPRPSRALPRAAAALIALPRLHLDSEINAISPTAAFGSFLPGAGATRVRVDVQSPAQARVEIRTENGIASVQVSDRPGEELRITDTPVGLTVDSVLQPIRAMLMIPSTQEAGRLLGLTPDETAVRLAPTYELPQTIFDYLLFLIVTVPTLGFVDVNYFFNLHEKGDSLYTNAARKSGIGSIRGWSTVALVLSVMAYVGIELLAGGTIGQLGSMGPMVHVFLGAILIVPAVAYAQVRAHRAYNRWAVRTGAPTLVLNLDDPAVRNREGISEIKIEIDGKPYSVYGIGHGTKSRSAFNTRLKKLGIQTIVDVREVPYSRRYPHFKKESLVKSLRKSGIGYLWFGNSLGGRKDFAQFMAVDPHHMFTGGVDRLVNVIKNSKGPVCLLGAPTNPFFCHRRLILEYLLKRYAVSPPKAKPREVQLNLFDDQDGGGRTAVLPSTEKRGRSLGLTTEQIALDFAPRRELVYTMADYFLFLFVAVLSFGFIRPNYFLNLHGRKADQDRTELSNEISIHFPSRPDYLESFNAGYHSERNSTLAPANVSARAVPVAGVDAPKENTASFISGLMGDQKSVVAIEIGGGRQSEFLKSFVRLVRDHGQIEFSEIFQLEMVGLQRLVGQDASTGEFILEEIPVSRLTSDQLHVNPMPAWHVAKLPAIAGRANLVVVNAPLLRGRNVHNFSQEIGSVSAPGATALIRIHQEDVLSGRLPSLMHDLQMEGFVLERFMADIPSDYPPTKYLSENPAPLLVFRKSAASAATERAAVESTLDAVNRTADRLVFLEAADALQYFGGVRAPNAAEALKRNQKRFQLRESERQDIQTTIDLLSGKPLADISTDDPRLPKIFEEMGRSLADLHRAGTVLDSSIIRTMWDSARVTNDRGTAHLLLPQFNPENAELAAARASALRIREARAGGIASIRIWSTVALILAVTVFLGVEILTGNTINQLGTVLGPLAHIALAGFLIVPSIAVAQVKTHRRYNRWALEQTDKPTLVIDDEQARQGEAAAVASREGASLQRMINHFNAIDVWLHLFNGPLSFPENLRPGNFIAPAQGDITEAWWDAVDQWWQPLMMRAHATMAGPNPQMNPQTAQFQAQLIGQRLTGQTVLEIGAGVGTTLLALSALGASKIHAVDSDPVSISRAQANVQLIANRTAEFSIRQDDATRLRTVERESIDTATMFATAVYVLPALRIRMFRRIFDVLKPGGRLVMVEYPPQGSPVPDGEEMLWSDVDWHDTLVEAGFHPSIEVFNNNGQHYYRIVAEKPGERPDGGVEPVPAMPPVELRAAIAGLLQDEMMLVAAWAHAWSARVDNVVPAEAIEEARKIMFGQAPLPIDMWQAAFTYLQSRLEEGYKKLANDLMSAASAVDQQVSDYYFGARNPDSTYVRLKKSERVAALLHAVIAIIDTREERAVMPRYLRADTVAIYSSTKGNFEAKDGLEKDRNEDFGIHHVLPDGTIFIFTGDGMGGYGHGDQAAQLAAASFYFAIHNFWKRHQGDERALTDVPAITEAFEGAARAGKTMIERNLVNTSAGVVFEVLYAHPRAGGGWFFANYHRGDARTEVGEAGKTLRNATIDNDSSGVVLSIDEVQERILRAHHFRLLRSITRDEDLVHEDLRAIYRRRSTVSGGLIEGRHDDHGFSMTYGELPDGAFVIQSTDGRLDPLTEAAAGRVVAGSVSLEAIARNLTEASQPSRVPGAPVTHVFRQKPDDALNQVAALGPVSSIEFGDLQEEKILGQATDMAAAALVALEADDRSAASAAIHEAQLLVAALPAQDHLRVISTRGLLRGIDQIIYNTATYFVVGENLRRDGSDLGYVVDDGALSPANVVMIQDRSDGTGSPYEEDGKVTFTIIPRSELVEGLGTRVERVTPDSDYFAQRQRIAQFRTFLNDAKRQGVEVLNNATLAGVKSELVNKKFPNGSAVVADGRNYLLIDNGATSDSPVPGMAFLYYPDIDEIGIANQRRMLDQRVETVNPAPDAARIEEGRRKLTEAFNSAGGLTLEAQRTRLVEKVEGNSWAEFGLSRDELEAIKARETELFKQRLSSLQPGDTIISKHGTMLVIDNGSAPTPLKPGETLVYLFGEGRARAWFLQVDREFFERTGIRELRPATDALGSVARAARDHIRELVSQPGNSVTGEVDELPWESVLPATIPEPTIDQVPPAGMIPGLRRILEPIFISILGLVRGRAAYQRIGAPVIEEGGFFSSLPLLIGWTLAGAGIDPYITAGIFLACFAVARGLFTWLHPQGERAPPTIISLALLLTAGPVALYFWFSPLGLALSLATAIAVHAVVNTATDTSSELNRAIDAAFPRVELLGLGSFTLEDLPLLGMSDSQAAGLADRIRTRTSSAPKISWQKVQLALRSRLAGERVRPTNLAGDRLALAVQGGSAGRRELDRRFIERLMGGAPEKGLVLFVDGSNPADQAYFSALSSRSGGRIQIIRHTSALIREENGSRILDLASLERALAASDGAWDGAAFVIPPDLAFDASGIGSGSLLRRLVFLFLDQSLRAMQATAADLRHLDTVARVIAQQA